MMIFEYALRRMRQGGKVQREIWGDEHEVGDPYITLNNGFNVDGQGENKDQTIAIQPFFTITLGDTTAVWLPTSADLLSEDWVIL
jgi:hypothetical protein